MIMNINKPYIHLPIIFLIQTILVLFFLPIIWNIFRIELIQNRLLDQSLKALLMVLFGVLWLYIFRVLYYRSYSKLSRCGRKN